MNIQLERDDVRLEKDGNKIAITVGGRKATMSVGEWSRMISRPLSVPSQYRAPENGDSA